jgi:GABA(A) receptor-associated protein
MENLKNKVKNLFNNTIDEYVDSLGYSYYKIQVPFEKRIEQSILVMQKYPNRLPIICDISKKLPKLDKHKYLIPDDLKTESFMFVIRRRIQLPPEQAMYFFVNNKLITGNKFMSQIYEKEKDEDGFLYVYVCAENTFG